MRPIESGEELRLVIAQGEGQRVEFKTFEDWDGHAKNLVCREIAAMANSGGGRLLLGISESREGPVASGFDEPLSRRITQEGALQHALDERMAPAPEIRVYSVALDGRYIVVIDIEPPYQATQPSFMPVMVTRDIQDESGKLRVARGSLLLREFDRSERVLTIAQLHQVMRPILERYRREELIPTVRAMFDQGLISQAAAQSFETEFRNRNPRFDAMIASLQSVNPGAARHDGMVSFIGAGEMSYARQHEVIERNNIYHRGWKYPSHNEKWWREEGDLVHEYHGPTDGGILGPPPGSYHEFWVFTPDGYFGSSLLDRVDLHDSANGWPLPPLSLDRPLDAIGVLWHVAEFVEFVKGAAIDLGVEKVWCAYRLANVLNRPMSSLNMQWPLANRLGDSDLGFAYPKRSNRADIEVSELFDAAALEGEWVRVASEWGTKVMKAFGVGVDLEQVRVIQDALIHMDNPWNATRRRNAGE